MRARFSEAASEDVREARAFFGKLGRQARKGFNADIRRAVALLRAYPEAGKLVGKTAREYVIGASPYSLVYFITVDEVVISAVYHHSRDPSFWHDRFGPER